MVATKEAVQAQLKQVWLVAYLCDWLIANGYAERVLDTDFIADMVEAFDDETDEDFDGKARAAFSTALDREEELLAEWSF